MVFIMIIAFTVAWTPYSLFALIEQFASEGIVSVYGVCTASNEKYTIVLLGHINKCMKLNAPVYISLLMTVPCISYGIVLFALYLLYGIVTYCTVSYCIVACCTVSYRIESYHIVLYCNLTLCYFLKSNLLLKTHLVKW